MKAKRKLKTSAPKLTTKQLKFIEVYDGNATEAARIAGYKGNTKTLQVVGAQNLSNPILLEAIKSRQDKKLRPLIATREDRQKFWTEVMNGHYYKTTDRLRAAELLGKSEADFTEKVKHEGEIHHRAKVVILTRANGTEAPPKKK